MMICHAYKFIFIHIPRCAGTSIEAWLYGRDWWAVDPPTKHLIASQARERYAEYWDEYFKFSIVRDPYARTRSLLKFGSHFGLSKDAGKPIDFSGYEACFGTDLVIEHDHRFAQRNQLITARHRPGRVYGNILDERLDFVGRFESLPHDMAVVQDRLNFPKPFDHHVERTKRRGRVALTTKDCSWVTATYREDFEDFGYPVRTTA